MCKSVRSLLLKSLTTTAIILWVGVAHAQQLSDKQKDSLLNNVVTVPGTDISIIPPAYFKPYVNDGKFGFIHEGAASSITIQEMKGTPFALVTQGLTKEYFESQGITYITKEDIKTKNNKDGTLFLVGFKVKTKDGKQDVEYERIMYFTGTYNRTIWVNANYPKVARDVLFNVLKTSVLTIQYGE
jgi:hypothetical protein